MTDPVVSVIVPTLNGARTLGPLLDRVREAGRTTPLEIVAIDSGSRDDTLAMLRGSGARVLDLAGEPFGHGRARNRAAAHARGRVLLFVTQDVEPVGPGWLAPLLDALEEPGVVGAFGRQIPRGASPEEAFLAAANYPETARRITATALARFAPGATLFSHAFGAMRVSAWQAHRIPDIVMSEDQAWARAVVEAGGEIRYVPSAAVYHGHAFGLWRAFRRNFDSGSSLQTLALAGGTWSAGARHLAAELRWIAARYGAVRAGRALVYEAVRMAGFQAGRCERMMPRGLARRLGEAPRP